MAKSKTYLAIDIGAGSGRAILGMLQGDVLELREIHRFENRPVILNDTLYWDFLFLWDNVLHALKKTAASGVGRLDGIGIDSFNCDFGLLDRRGNLISNPISYRDRASGSALQYIRDRIDEQELYEITGVGYLSITALVRLIYMRKTFGPGYLEHAAVYLPLSDLFRSFLTGSRDSEETIIWGSQLVDIRTKQYSERLLNRFDIPQKLLPDLIRPGTLCTGLTDSLKKITGIPDTPVIAVAGHDTISASVALVHRAPGSAFVSIGTWSILGVLLDKPETGSAAFSKGFLNEIGVQYTLFARNMMGFYVLESLIEIWKVRGVETSYERLIDEAAETPPFALKIDVNDPAFFSSVNMEQTLDSYLASSGQGETRNTGILVRAILESLACSYAGAISDLEQILGKGIVRLAVLGGGVRNRLLCQMIADAAQLEVVAGAAEATVAGNMGMQLVATGVAASVHDLKPLFEGCSTGDSYRPRNHDAWKVRLEGGVH